MSLTTSDVFTQFADADWSFAGSAPRHEFHPYPARFVSDFPRQVIELTEPDGPVVDPFCGSGTPLFEARRAGRGAVGSDINPIACLISRVRTTPIPAGEVDGLRDAAAAVREAAARSREVDAAVRAIPRLDHWFSLPAQLAMAGARGAVAVANVSNLGRDVLAAGVSAATVRISNQESDTRYAAVDKGRTQAECATILEDSIVKTVRSVVAATQDVDAATQLIVRESDAQDLSWLDSDSAGLACFSPPYPNAYEYWLYHKYRMYWLGVDPIRVRSQEIGARPHYCRPNGLTEVDFADQMTRAYGELLRVLKPGAYAVALVGDSFIGGRQIDNGSLLSNAAEDAGFDIVGSLVRPVAENRSSFNRAHSRGRKTEHIVISRKPE